MGTVRRQPDGSTSTEVLASELSRLGGEVDWLRRHRTVGGGSSSGIPILTDTNGQGWVVSSDTDGTLRTTTSAGDGVTSFDVGGGHVLSVDTDGSLVTTEVV